MALSFIALAAAISFALPNTFELTHDWRPLSAVGVALLFSAAIFVMYLGRQTLSSTSSSDQWRESAG